MLKRANLEKLRLNFKKLKITKQLNCSDDFWKQFGIWWKFMGLYEKVMGLYEIANTITFNPKEYFEKFKNQQINKKYKGVRRDNSGMNFEKFWMKNFY